jgi:hypothetical protein
VDIQPDGSRVATGGAGACGGSLCRSVRRLRTCHFSCINPLCLSISGPAADAKVMIWSMAPILSEAAEADAAQPQKLCSLSTHQGSVLIVRWSSTGRCVVWLQRCGVATAADGDVRGPWPVCRSLLASAGEDQLVILWMLSSAPQSARAGYGLAQPEKCVENWVPRATLRSHQLGASLVHVTCVCKSIVCIVVMGVLPLLCVCVCVRVRRAPTRRRSARRCVERRRRLARVM